MKTSLKIIAMSLLSILNIGANAQSIKSANNLFKEGNFLRAEEIYADVLKNNPDNLKAQIYMGYIAQLTNRMEESDKWFKQVATIQPKLKLINNFLAVNAHRQKQYANAANHFRASGREAMAKKMESFANCEAYKIQDNFDEIRVKFIVADPLPIVEVTINGEYKGYFFIDTGGGEIILDESFAEKVKADFFGKEKGSEFGGGKKAPISHGKISSITLGNQVIENIPVIILNLNQLELAGYKMDGVIGTVFLYQFLSTIDYKNGQLILRNKSKFGISDILENSLSPKIIPFTLADDHFIMARGTVNSSDTLMLFVDTGLAGNAFTCPKSTLKKADLKYKKDSKTKTLGGGGFFNSYAIEIEKICLDNACVENLHGTYGAFPPQFENSFGFTINGLISHEFFRNYSLTIDFQEMKLILSE